MVRVLAEHDALFEYLIKTIEDPDIWRGFSFMTFLPTQHKQVAIARLTNLNFPDTHSVNVDSIN